LQLTYVGDPYGIVVVLPGGGEIEVAVNESADFPADVAANLLLQAPTKWQKTKAADESGTKEK
jgi:hypothetical protein